MKSEDKLRQIIFKYRYPLLILLLGVVLLLFSGRSYAHTEKPEGSAEERLQELLAATEGVGEARVLISESGVIVACRGADDAQTKLNILRAVNSFTGFGSDKITILKLRGA